MEMPRLVLRTGPPLGCLLLMLLLVLGIIILPCSDVVLHLETLQEAWDVHRLITHVLCTSDNLLILLSLVLFPLLFWRMEERLGTLYFLQLSCLCTLCSAILYLLTSFLLPPPAVPASGYLATQLSLLVAKHKAVGWRFGKKISFLLPYGILIVTQLLFPESSLLYHICGIISGLASRAGLLRHLELPFARRQALDSMHLCDCLTSFNLARFIPTQEESSAAQERLPFSYTDAYESVLSNDLPIRGATLHTSSVTNFRETPVWLGDPASLEEEMLEAGILASLRDYEEQEKLKQEPALNKSSVSALRLQQLERMGFPTGPAVVALAATGKVERAVSLLVEGEIGGDIAVADVRQSSRGHLNTIDAGHLNS
ncbi:rhomboid domain-containing protein 3 [Bufo gargarizans]|uniref:rhomboid domain-containing protein 3 n=1 Tax=Bufo gargarizans TaxID=30331 RepID=UPI001CF4DAC6|nr:rhomboid domain-containing protein 3 [Bufo gargarizans]XP_044144512.1 rhomboid domain-containing protein 3 [Bufo gargarizans]